MPTRKVSDAQQQPSKRKPTTTAKHADATEDPDISDTESYFSSKYEPEYLTRLSLAVANGEKRRNRPLRPFRHHIRPIKHEHVPNEGPGSPGTLSTLSVKSDEVTGFRYLEMEESQERPTFQFTRRQRSNSEASMALPQISSTQFHTPDREQIEYDDLDSDSDSDSDSLKSLEAGFLNPHQQRRAQHDGQRCVSPSRRLRGFALRPSKSTVNISSPALANRLGVPLSAELEVWV